MVLYQTFQNQWIAFLVRNDNGKKYPIQNSKNIKCLEINKGQELNEKIVH